MFVTCIAALHRDDHGKQQASSIPFRQHQNGTVLGEALGAAVITAPCRVQDERDAEETVSGTRTLLLLCRLASVAKQTRRYTQLSMQEDTHTLNTDKDWKLSVGCSTIGPIAGYKRSHLRASTTVQIRRNSANCATLYRNRSTVHYVVNNTWFNKMQWLLYARRQPAVSCAKTAESMEMPFGRTYSYNDGMQCNTYHTAKPSSNVLHATLTKYWNAH